MKVESFVFYNTGSSGGGALDKVPITKYQTLKPKDGKGYTWRRVRRGEWTRVSTLPPDDLFPQEALVSQEVHELNQRTRGNSAAHAAEKFEN